VKFTSIEATRLWLRIDDPQLQSAILTLRSHCSALAARVVDASPGMTDHSVRHLDALWGVADVAVSEAEFSRLTTGEAFLLGASLYLHDIGMAFAATAEGLSEVRASAAYREFLERVRLGIAADQWDAARGATERRATSYAIRKMHADASMRMSTAAIPGTGIYLLEPIEVREQWGPLVGKIAGSHHWSLEEIESQLGRTGEIPLANVGKGDPAFVACLLRLIDYAHISQDRASTLDRAFRQQIDPDSLAHWLAQEHIQGPERVGNDLVYRTESAIEDVDAWWLYHSMATGLDAEIRGVRRYVDKREVSRGRLSLSGVKGASTPEEFSAFVETGGFLPIEANIRTGSVERLVELLGGESLYGPKKFVAVRELIQNARDAVALKRTLATTEPELALAALPINVRLTTAPKAALEVVDHGIGMNREIIQDYLVTIAADYWRSEKFFREFPSAYSRGFRPAGRFGIGFMSVFMLGNDIEVSTNRDGDERFSLALKGVGRRGAIRASKSGAGSGTSVRVYLREGSIESIKQLDAVVRGCAPMLDLPVTVAIDGHTSKLVPGWWSALSPPELIDHVYQTAALLHANLSATDYLLDRRFLFPRRRLSPERIADAPWVADWPQWKGPQQFVLAHPELSETVLCVHGIAVGILHTPGFVGMVNLTDAATDVSRREVQAFDTEALLAEARTAACDGLVRHFDKIGSEGFVTEHAPFIDHCIRLYGDRSLRLSTVAWISAVRPPGNVETLSTAEFLARAAGAGRVRVAYGVGPWSAMKAWAKEKPGKEAAGLDIVIDECPGGGPSYDSESKSGTLSEIWPRLRRASSFGLLMSLVAEAWQVDRKSLGQAPNWVAERGHAWGEFTRER